MTTSLEITSTTTNYARRSRFYVYLLYCGILALLPATQVHANLILTGIFDGPLTGGEPKIVELFATADIADLSTYGLESATNSAAATAAETLLSGSLSAGEFLYVFNADSDMMVAPIDRLSAFLGFTPTNTIHDSTAGAGASFNGDDGIVLWNGAIIIDRFGTDADADDPGEDWDYQDGWAYRVDGTGPDNPFVMANWSFSGENVNDGETDNATASNPFPVGTYSDSVPTVPEPATLTLMGLALAGLGFRRHKSA